MHQPTNGTPALFLFLFFSRDMTHIIIRKIMQAITCLEKKEGAGFPFVCRCGSNKRMEFQTETRKIERGIAVVLLVLITTCLTYKNRFVLWSYLMAGDKLGSATGIDRLLASSGLPTPIWNLIGNDNFWSCHTH